MRNTKEADKGKKSACVVPEWPLSEQQPFPHDKNVAHSEGAQLSPIDPYSESLSTGPGPIVGYCMLWEDCMRGSALGYAIDLGVKIRLAFYPPFAASSSPCPCSDALSLVHLLLLASWLLVAGCISE